MDLEVSAGGVLTAESLRSCLRAGRDPEKVILDLSSARFIDPAGLVMIAALAERAALDGKQSVFLEPRDDSCATYLSRMHLGDALEAADASHAIRPVVEHDRGDTLVELQRFHSEDELDDLTDKIMHVLISHGQGRWTQAVYDALYEFALNAVDHSGRGGGFLALQTFKRSSDIALAIADSGRGIKAALNASGRNLSSDEAAISVAARQYESSVNAPGRGRGLSTVIQGTGRHRGTVLLMSGRAIGKFTNGHIDPRVSLLPDAFPGTLAQARLAI